MASNSSARRQTGFTMIEILVTMVVLAIGLLGIAGMQAYGMRNNHAAYTKTQATNLAIDMADRIRANPNGIDNYANFDTNGTIPNDPACITTGCTPAELADYDKLEWSSPIRGQNKQITTTTKPVLPQGRGLIEQSGDEFSVTILWHEPLASDQNTIPKKCKDFAGSDIAAEENTMACYQLRFIP